MRCYFLRGGHICAVELLTGPSDEAAINQAKALFEKRKNEFAGFEVWDRARVVYRHLTPSNYAVKPEASTVGRVPTAGTLVPQREPEITTGEVDHSRED